MKALSLPSTWPGLMRPMPVSITREIEWVDAMQCTPDAEELVLLAEPNGDVFFGWWDGERWVDGANVHPIIVTHWAALPTGPQA